MFLQAACKPGSGFLAPHVPPNAAEPANSESPKFGPAMTAVLAGPGDGGIVAATQPCRCHHPRATLAATILGSSVAFIDGSVVNVALPTLQHDLGASAAGLSWTINAYLLPLGALILIGGGLGDHFGRRRLFLIGLSTFTLASLACAVAPSLVWLLGGRGLQGLGAALLMPNSLAILGAAFTGERRGRAVGTWAAMGALAGAIGPVLGGWLVDMVGWRMIFLINLPIASAAGCLAWAYVAESRDTRQAAPLDWRGAVLATAGLALLTWALTAAASANAGATMIWPAALLGCALLVSFVMVEAWQGERAIMPLSMFATPAFVGLTLLTFLVYGSLTGLLVLLPFLLIKVAGMTAIASGATVLPVPVLVGLGSPLMGSVTGRYGGRWPLALGASVVAAGLAMYARVGLEDIHYFTVILPATVLVGLGMAVVVAPLTTSVMASVAADQIGTASGFNSAVARVAGLVATGLVGFVFAMHGSAGGLVGAFRLAALVGAAATAAGAACAVILIPHSPKAAT